MMSPTERNSARNSQQVLFDRIREVEFGCRVPSHLHVPKHKLIKSIYLKNNMQQLKVFTKKKEDIEKYRNDRGYIFYTPHDTPIDRQIVDSGGRVFDYKVEHQQKQHSKEDLYGSSRQASDLDRKMRSIDVSF